MNAKKIIFITVFTLVFSFLMRMCFRDIKEDYENKQTNISENTNDSLLIYSFVNDDSLKALNEINYFENKLKKSFWSKFQQTNKYGRAYGSIETTFDQDKYIRFVESIGFVETQNGTLMDFDGVRNNFHIFLNNNGAIPSNSGWVQKWEIIVRKEKADSVYEMKRELLLSPR